MWHYSLLLKDYGAGLYFFSGTNKCTKKGGRVVVDRPFCDYQRVLEL